MEVYKNDSKFTIKRGGVEYIVLGLYGENCCSVVKKDADPNIPADIKLLQYEGIRKYLDEREKGKVESD